VINLIGPDRKKQILAARRNSIWVRYTFLLLSVLATISIILGGTAFYFYGQKLSQDATNKANQEKLFTAEYKKNSQVVTDFRKKLNTAKTIFDAETYNSLILLDVSKTMPAGTVLNDIKFDSSTFQGQQTLIFQTKSIEGALALKSAFEKNPPLSSEVHFSVVERIPSDSGTEFDRKYPIRITMFMELKKPSSTTGAAAKPSGAGSL
jgi:hypothetical protein